MSHSYGRGGSGQALGPLDLEVAPGEFLVLVGASGCGKSTLLRLIAGFERPTEGTLTVSGALPVPGASAGVVFQQPRLFPWRSVGGNVDLALTYARVPRDLRPERRAAIIGAGWPGGHRLTQQGQGIEAEDDVMGYPPISRTTG